jgi:hypothetical protein
MRILYRFNSLCEIHRLVPFFRNTGGRHEYTAGSSFPRLLLPSLAGASLPFPQLGGRWPADAPLHVP